MLKRNLFLFLASYFCFNISAQNKTDTLRLYYNINEFQSEENFKRIDSLITALNGRALKIKIVGYADFLNTNSYNQTLSQKRADAAKNHLLKRIPPSQMQSLSVKAMGERFSKNNQSPQGEAFQRRVDIIIEPLISLPQSDNKNESAIVKKRSNQNNKNIEDLAQGESLAVEGLNFEPGRHYLVKEAIPVLNKLLKTLQTNKKLKVEIQGHICCLMDDVDGMDLDTHEKKLSENRAKGIYDFLVGKGIDTARLSYKGYGRSKPKILPETTPEEEQMNRRVEILIIEK